ncbi:hypothetical protein ZWY2020_043871, partial [Hordeum vulgare]
GTEAGCCPSCGGPVVATDVERERRILCLLLCVKNNRKYTGVVEEEDLCSGTNDSLVHPSGMP